MPDSVCGMGLACTWRTARLVCIAINDNRKKIIFNDSTVYTATRH